MHACKMNVWILFQLVLLLLRVSVSLGSLNGTNSSSSPWLSKVARNLREVGCWDRPWICDQGEVPPPPHSRVRRICCRNRCVDVMSDVNNCGLCGFRCQFPLQCCRGMCVNTNVNPFHCGRCENRCPFFTFCVYGMCGYAQPPFPPRPPHPPLPPLPPRPPHPPLPPHPPIPPHPPLPPPHPFPPHPPHDDPHDPPLPPPHPPHDDPHDPPHDPHDPPHPFPPHSPHDPYDPPTGDKLPPPPISQSI